MSRVNGKDSKVYLGERDATQDITSMALEFTAQTHDTTTMGDDWQEAIAGLLGWEANFDAFHDPAEGAIGRQLEDPGATINAVSVVDGDGDAIGDNAVVLGPGIFTKRGQAMPVADMIKLSGNLKGNGRSGLFGKLLHVLGQETTTGDGASHANNTGAYTASTLAFVSATKKITDSANGLASFLTGDYITVSGSVANDGTYTIVTGGVAGEIVVTEALTDEGAGASVTLERLVSSASGGRGNLHITAITGTWTIKIQHSVDNSVWADLITFTQATAAGGAVSESLAVTGTVNRYLQITWTEDVAGSITFAVTFARY